MAHPCRWDPPPGSGAAPPARPRPRELGGGGWGRSPRSRWGDGPASASRQHQSRRRRGSRAHRAQHRTQRGRGGGAWSTASAGLSPEPGGGGGGGDVARGSTPVRPPARLAAGGGPRACAGPCLEGEGGRAVAAAARAGPGAEWPAARTGVPRARRCPGIPAPHSARRAAPPGPGRKGTAEGTRSPRGCLVTSPRPDCPVSGPWRPGRLAWSSPSSPLLSSPLPPQNKRLGSR